MAQLPFRDALTKLEVALCTGILPSRPAEQGKTPTRKPDCSGRVRYLTPGQPEPDPREWQFRNQQEGKLGLRAVRRVVVEFERRR